MLQPRRGREAILFELYATPRWGACEGPRVSAVSCFELSIETPACDASTRPFKLFRTGVKIEQVNVGKQMWGPPSLGRLLMRLCLTAALANSKLVCPRP